MTNPPPTAYGRPLKGATLAAQRSRFRGVHSISFASMLPVLVVTGTVFVLWYAVSLWLNAPQVIERFDAKPYSFQELATGTWNMERPVLPTPHQIARNFFESVFTEDLDSPRNLLLHAGVTLQSTLLGFAMGVILGVLIAVQIVHSPWLDRSLMPWVVASQTIPILAIAPMIVVVLGSLGWPMLVPKAIISMYLCFFPVTIGMVKGLRSPDPLQMDLMRTYSASKSQTLSLLRLPASLPFLFASAKVAIVASLIGAIVGELPTGAQSGLGARLLSGSYYGQTVQIWSALLMASLLGVGLVSAVQWAQHLTGKQMGART